MLRVKICGITSIEDALHAAACGADALGFVFHEESPRCVTPERARSLVAALPPFIVTVGLFVNQPRERVAEVAGFCGLDVVQLHGDEPPENCRVSGRRVIKAIRVRDRDSLENLNRFSVSAFLLDAWDPDRYGGTGRSVNLDLATTVARKHRIILAGGLKPDTVAEAIRVVAPYGVDVSSGVESTPGRKDPELVAAFIRAAKNAAT